MFFRELWKKKKGWCGSCCPNGVPRAAPHWCFLKLRVDAESPRWCFLKEEGRSLFVLKVLKRRMFQEKGGKKKGNVSIWVHLYNIPVGAVVWLTSVGRATETSPQPESLTKQPPSWWFVEDWSREIGLWSKREHSTPEQSLQLDGFDFSFKRLFSN